jgi:hypothetical protein
VADPFVPLFRDIYKLYSIWPQLDSATIVRFGREVYNATLEESDIQNIRQACGLDNPRFQKLGRTIVGWKLAQELSTFGYRGKSKDKLVASCVSECEKLAMGKFSPMLISEWVEDYYEELAAFATQPIRIRVYAAERAKELRELLGCEQLPLTSLQG